MTLPTPSRQRVQRVVVVNGNPSVCEAIDDIFDQGRYEMAFVDVGDDAYANVKQLDPSVIVVCMRTDELELAHLLTMFRLDDALRKAGSVSEAEGLSPVLQRLLARWPKHPKVDLVTTDGFLLPNAILEREGLMSRKGFPESYDTRRLLQFLREVKSGEAEVSAPVYSHVVYDIVDGDEIEVHQPDILIIEGLNVLQAGPRVTDAQAPTATEFVSDYFDFSIYVDADEAVIEDYYVQRFLKLCETVFQNPDSFFQNYAHLTHEQAVATARGIWHEINGKNLRENIEPTKGRASLLLRKGPDHRATDVSLRRL